MEAGLEQDARFLRSNGKSERQLRDEFRENKCQGLVLGVV